MKKLYRFTWDMRRQGMVRGIFVADDSEIAAAMGKNVDFGEILGKHSEVYGMLEDSDLEILTDDPAFIAKFEEYDCASGYNPLQYIDGQ